MAGKSEQVRLCGSAVPLRTRAIRVVSLGGDLEVTHGAAATCERMTVAHITSQRAPGQSATGRTVEDLPPLRRHRCTGRELPILLEY
jgi:hypothetical protein